MDILSNLPTIKDESQDREVKSGAPKNGPARYRTPTNGQLRRARERFLKGQTRKARRNQIQNYFATQRLGAYVHAHLQAAGVLPYAEERELDLHQQAVSAAWLVARFGVEATIEDDEGNRLKTGEVSFAYFDVLEALRNALKFYGQVAGLEDLRIPDDYVVPIYEEGTKPAGTDVLRKGWSKDGNSL